MGLNRRSFLATTSLGGAAYLVNGCDSGTGTPPGDTTAPPCELPEVTSPPPLDYPPSEYFEKLAAEIDAAGIGAPIVVVDLDRLDSNVDAIVAAIPPPLSYRIVEKSLPSLDLLAYVAERSQSSKFLVLHLPFLNDLLAAFPAAEVMVGKCHLASAVRAFFESLPESADLAEVAGRVIFLADTEPLLNDLVALAGSLEITLRVAVEIDVGLRRSGVRRPGDLPALLDVFTAESAVKFAGFLGYDGHVAFAPAGDVDAVNDAWAAATAEYRAFVDVLEGDYPELAALSGLVFNSGGSATFPMYTKDTPVNDVAAGGGALRPGGYPDHVISALRPAIFIATPVLRQYPAPELPFFSPEQSQKTLAGLQGLTIYGGGWPAYYTYPPGIRPAPLVHDPTDVSLVPNQGMVVAPAELAIEPGDWVFYHPRQSDAMFQFDRIWLVRGGELQAETMAPYPRRY